MQHSKTKGSFRNVKVCSFDFHDNLKKCELKKLPVFGRSYVAVLLTQTICCRNIQPSFFGKLPNRVSNFQTHTQGSDGPHISIFLPNPRFVKFHLPSFARKLLNRVPISILTSRVTEHQTFETSLNQSFSTLKHHQNKDFHKLLLLYGKIPPGALAQNGATTVPNNLTYQYSGPGQTLTYRLSSESDDQFRRYEASKIRLKFSIHLRRNFPTQVSNH